ncbi:MAG: hypothetical protein AAF434_17180 [Pseudomonadota bacterium]
MNVSEFREKYPQYSDLSDEALAKSLYDANQDSYSDMSFEEFANGFGVTVQPTEASQEESTRGSVIDALGQGVSLGFADELTAGINATIGTFDDEFDGTTWIERYKGMRDISRDDLKAYREREPELALAAELSGSLLTGGVSVARAAVAKGGNAAQNFVRNVSAGAKAGGVYGAGSSDADNAVDLAVDTGMGALYGGAGSGLFTFAGVGANKLMRKGIRPDTDKAHTTAVDILDEANIPLTTGQRSGSDRVQALETTLGQSIWGPRIEKIWNEQRQTLQSKLMEKAGFATEDIASGTFGDAAILNAKDKFAQRYSEALANKFVRLDRDSFIDELAAIEKKNMQYLPINQRKDVARYIDEFIDEAASSKGLSGERYQGIRSRLLKSQRALQNNDPRSAQLFSDLADALDDEFLAAADKSTATAKRKIDQEYARFKQIETLYKRGGKQVEAGVIPLAGLSRESRKRLYDKEWRSLISASNRALVDSIPNSGTASRVLNQALPIIAPSTATASTLGVPFVTQQLLSRGVGGNIGRATTPELIEKLRKGSVLTALPSVALEASNKKVHR